MADKSDKAPAFQFYPMDWDADTKVIPMSYEEEGIYWALCRRYWLDGNTLPNDLNALRDMLKSGVTAKKLEIAWRRIGKCFQVVDDRLVHKRLDKERRKQAENRLKRQQAAAERWAKRQQTSVQTQPNVDAQPTDVHKQKSADVDAMQSLSSSSSSSSSSSASAEQQQRPVTGPWAQREPRSDVDRSHKNHLFGFCDWVCLPAFLLNEFIRHGGKDEGTVNAWAQGIRREWEGRRIGDNLEFWRARWDESAPKPAASADDAFTKANDAIKRQIAEERKRREDVLR